MGKLAFFEDNVVNVISRNTEGAKIWHEVVQVVVKL